MFGVPGRCPAEPFLPINWQTCDQSETISQRSGLEVSLPDLRLDILPSAQRALWAEFHRIPGSFVLYGGTAIALRLGHRQSIDFDFFSNDKFDPATLLANLEEFGAVRVDQRGNNTLSIMIDREGPVRVSFFGDVRMNSVAPPDLIAANRIQIASLLDLTATKLKTIQQRAEAKDYIDLNSALQNGIELPQALSAATAIYGPTFNALATLKALTYFGDGDLASLPTTIQNRLYKSAEGVRVDRLPHIAVRSGILGSHSL